MNCIDCETAATRDWYSYRNGCKSCTARAYSRGPDFDRVRKAGKLDSAYQRTLERAGLTHAEVKSAFEADRVNKKEGT